MKRLTPTQIRHVYDQGPDAVVDLVTHLFDVIDRLESEVHALKSRVTELERQIHRNSHNSSQPPSADGLKKPPPKSQRRPSGRPRGGQPGHLGETLKMVDAPDVVERHPVALCEDCGGSLDAVAPERIIRRQVFDIPPLSLTVTEHQAEINACPMCHHQTMGIFPADVVAPAQYGARIVGLATYLQVFPMIPIDRIRQLFFELLGQAPSGRTLVDAATRIGNRVQPLRIPIREALRQAPVIPVDETGFRVEGRLW